MILPPDIPVYGDTAFRGTCAKEAMEQATFFARLRRQYPDTWGALAIHIQNEGKRDHMRAARDKAQGMVTGACDIVIPAAPAFVCELKRRDHTKSKLHQEQLGYMRAAQFAGAFVCIALGADAAQEAFMEYTRNPRARA